MYSCTVGTEKFAIKIAALHKYRIAAKQKKQS